MSKPTSCVLILLKISRKKRCQRKYGFSSLVLISSRRFSFCFNFFFLPPLYTLTIAHSENWIALIVFFTTALAVGQLSARAKQRAEEAESRKREAESLYAQLQAAFERESEAEASKR